MGFRACLGPTKSFLTCSHGEVFFFGGDGKAFITLAYQNLLFCRVPINSILGFIVRTYKEVGFGSLR